MSIVNAMRDFLSLSDVDYYECNFGALYRGISHSRTSKIEDGEIVVEMPYDYLDLGTVAEIERFLTDLDLWSDSVYDIRHKWLRDNDQLGLANADNFRMIFGDQCYVLDEIRARVRRIVNYIEAIDLAREKQKPRESNDSDDEILRADLLKFVGITSQALTNRIKTMGHPKPIRTSGKKEWFSLTQIEQWEKTRKNA